MVLEKSIFVTGLVKCLGLFCAFGKGLIVWSYLCLCGFGSAPEVLLSKYLRLAFMNSCEVEMSCKYILNIKVEEYSALEPL